MVSLIWQYLVFTTAADDQLEGPLDSDHVREMVSRHGGKPYLIIFT